MLQGESEILSGEWVIRLSGVEYRTRRETYIALVETSMSRIVTFRSLSMLSNGSIDSNYLEFSITGVAIESANKRERTMRGRRR